LPPYKSLRSSSSISLATLLPLRSATIRFFYELTCICFIWPTQRLSRKPKVRFLEENRRNASCVWLCKLGELCLQFPCESQNFELEAATLSTTVTQSDSSRASASSKAVALLCRPTRSHTLSTMKTIQLGEASRRSQRVLNRRSEAA